MVPDAASPGERAVGGRVELHELKAGMRVDGLVATGTVTVRLVEPHGEDLVNVLFRTDEGALGERLVNASQVGAIEIAAGARWRFDADGTAFKLASEARRIQLAHLFDPFSAIETSTIEALPHQVEAVYERMLPQLPLRFLLADDPGAGKTIMSGLLIRELLLRGDLERCLVVAPGSLVEQWQEELDDKFELRFDILSRDMVESARTGNPFLERSLLIARMDQLARNADLQAKLGVSEWDLVIVDEAHKMSAHVYGDKVERTQRFVLGEQLRDRARNFLLLTATPHSGDSQDFLQFLSLLDPERFGGRLRRSDELPDLSDVMRRYVKEKLLDFDGKRLFPERVATSPLYDLSPEEQRLYDDVTTYVRNGMDRAKKIEEGGDRRRGLAAGFALTALQRRLASSPAAIHHSLRRRREKLSAQLSAARRAGTLATANGLGARVGDPDGFDSDDYDDEELERLEDEAIENAMTAESMAELEWEIEELRRLEAAAGELRASGTDRKWVQLSDLLQSSELDPSRDEPRKLIVFTEHRDTLDYLVDRITTLLGRSDVVAAIHGGIRREERRRIQESFRVDRRVQILVATDAAGEGVNLQRANLMVNYDLPWNPNRIEQRFGRIHRIGQSETCHLWNLVAHNTREGDVFHRLFEKMEAQKAAYGDQVYDVLGDAEINRSLQDLLVEAIRYDEDPARKEYVNQVIDAEIGPRLTAVLNERAISTYVMGNDRRLEVRRRMEEALSRKLQPGFVRDFFRAALDDLGGRIVAREPARFEITRVPSSVRSRQREVTVGGSVHNAYERVTFDKNHVQPAPGERSRVRAELICPGHPLLDAVLSTVLERYGDTLTRGAMLLDPEDGSEIARVLLYLEHSITDGRLQRGERRVVSKRFQFVEIAADGSVRDPGAEPYLRYEPVEEDLGERVRQPAEVAWIDEGIDQVARTWATTHFATPHLEEVAQLTTARVQRTRRAVTERLDAEIRYWDARAAELKKRELAGKNVRLNSGRARQRADELEARKQRRLRELELEADLVNHLPVVVGAALVIPLGLLERAEGKEPGGIDPEVARETDRRAVAAVMATERALGRKPKEQVHNNPGFDILSEDPLTGRVYQIEVKGHLPDTREVKISAPQVRQAQQNPERFRLVVVEVPRDPAAEPTVSYFVRPFDHYELHFAQTYVPLDVADLAPYALEPQ